MDLDGVYPLFQPSWHHFSGSLAVERIKNWSEYILLYGPRSEKICLWEFANNKDEYANEIILYKNLDKRTCQIVSLMIE